MEITTQATERAMYAAGLAAALSSMARGEPDEVPSAGPSPLVRAYADGYADAGDDSDEPRPSGPALDDPRGLTDPNDLDEVELRAVAASVYQEIDRVGADVSAWPDYGSGRIRVADEVADVAHEPHALLATLRGLPTGAGTDAMWRAVTR